MSILDEIATMMLEEQVKPKDEFFNTELIPYLNQRPDMLQQAVEFWQPQINKAMGPSLQETIAQMKEGTYKPPTAQELWEDPFMQALNPSNIGFAATYVGPKSRLWKEAEQAGDVGSALKLFHGSRSDLVGRNVSKYSWIHLGTEEQAGFFHKTGKVYPVNADLSNPAPAVRDANWDYDLVDALDALTYDNGPFSSLTEEYWKLRDKLSGMTNDKAKKELADALESKGYDGIIYPNEVEGSGLSYATWNKNKIKVRHK